LPPDIENNNDMHIVVCSVVSFCFGHCIFCLSIYGL
jgi:hypothetical protein